MVGADPRECETQDTNIFYEGPFHAYWEEQLETLELRPPQTHLKGFMTPSKHAS